MRRELWSELGTWTSAAEPRDPAPSTGKSQRWLRLCDSDLDLDVDVDIEVVVGVGVGVGAAPADGGGQRESAGHGSMPCAVYGFILRVLGVGLCQSDAVIALAAAVAMVVIVVVVVLIVVVVEWRWRTR